MSQQSFNEAMQSSGFDDETFKISKANLKNCLNILATDLYSGSYVAAGVLLSPLTATVINAPTSLILRTAASGPFTLTSDLDGVKFDGSASKSYDSGFYDVPVSIPANVGMSEREITLTATIDGASNKTISIITQSPYAENYTLIDTVSLYIANVKTGLCNVDMVIQDRLGTTTLRASGDCTGVTTAITNLFNLQHLSGVQRIFDGNILMYDNAEITINTIRYGSGSEYQGWAVMFGSVGVSVQDAAGKYMLNDYSQVTIGSSAMLITRTGYEFLHSQLGESYPSSLGVDEIIGSGNIGQDFPWLTDPGDISVYLPMPWRNPIAYAGLDAENQVNYAFRVMPYACSANTVFNPALQVCDHPINVPIPPNGFSD